MSGLKRLDSLEIRVFRENDIRQVLKLCNDHMKFDKLSKDLLWEKTFYDPKYEKELNFTAWEKDILIGFLSGTTREIKSEKIGYVKLMTVHQKFQRRTIGRKLYENLEDIYRDRGIKKINIYDVPHNYFMPGIDPRYTPAIAFFESMGFHRFSDAANMIADLTSQDFDTAHEEKELAERGININRAAYGDRKEVFNFIDSYFPSWNYEVGRAFNSSPISLHIARSTGKVMAFSAHNCNNTGTGWFGPMGTHPKLRGKGVGSVLLKRCMKDIKNWGLTESTIPWVGPIRFYSYYVNAVIQRVFWRYEKLL